MDVPELPEIPILEEHSPSPEPQVRQKDVAAPTDHAGKPSPAPLSCAPASHRALAASAWPSTASLHSSLATFSNNLPCRLRRKDCKSCRVASRR